MTKPAHSEPQVKPQEKEGYTIDPRDVHKELSAAIMPIALAHMKGLCHPHDRLLPVLTRALNVIVQFEAKEDTTHDK